MFSLVLLSCDQSIAQEMGSLESCLSKISYFTGWSVLRAHSAPSLPRANISVTCVVGARRRPHILCSVKGHVSLYAPMHPLPGQLGGQGETLIWSLIGLGVVQGSEDLKTKSSKFKLRWECFLLLIKNRVLLLGYSDEPRVNIYPLS